MASFKPRGRSGHSSRIRRGWMIVGLAAFVLVDIALVAFALGGPFRAPATEPADTAVVEPVETTTPTPKPVVTKKPVETVELADALPPTRILAALDGSLAWRAVTGPCPAAQALPERTTDGGATWTPSDATRFTGSSAILSIRASSKTEASMVTLSGEGCAPQYDKTFVSGDEWKDYPDRLGGNWYVDPADRASVHSPSGSFSAPCPTVIAFAPRGDTDAGVLCADGAFSRTSDGGASWGKAVSLPGAVNLSAAGSGYLLAAVGQKDCAGVQVLSTSKALDGALSPTGCREAKIKPGQVALSSADGVVWLWAGNAMSKSSDGGATWQ